MSILEFDSVTTKYNEALEENLHTLPADPLVISCTLHRLTSVGPSKYRSYSITNNCQEILPHVTDQDIVLARDIRSDFRKKLTYFSLTVGPLSKFKSSLNDFLEIEFQSIGECKLHDKYAGMIFKLPYFYAYNMQLQELFNCNTPSPEKEVFQANSVNIKFLSKLDSGRAKTKNSVEYWFEDDAGVRIMVLLTCDNPILPIFDRYISEGKHFNFSGKLRKRSNYAVNYYVASNWNIS